MFEFDSEKSAANLAKHGIDFEQAQAIWQDQRRLMSPTYPGGDGEVRQLIIGMIDDKLWAAVITLREEAIRIISVRRARKVERAVYGGQDN